MRGDGDGNRPNTTLNQRYDIIGDIHGHADELVALLRTLGYAREGGAFRHPNGRKAIFLGDFIDRGPKIREVLGTVRSMVEAGSVLVVLGNHEINAMRFHILGGDGKPLRPHTDKNIDQHRATLEQFPDQNEWKGWIDWFAGLPLFLDLDRLRVVHACWDTRAVEATRKLGRLENGVLERYSHPGTAEYDAISQIHWRPLRSSWTIRLGRSAASILRASGESAVLAPTELLPSMGLTWTGQV